MSNKITLPQLAWHGVKELELTFPDSWEVEVFNMAGYNRPHMKAAEIKQVVADPIGMAPLREYARGKKEVVIIFDDMTRVTRVAEIVPHVLEELAAAGIRDSQIRFIAACGCHGAMDRLDFVKKLGKDVLKRFPVYNHAPYGKCVYAGTTKSGIKVRINAEVMKCDLKIGVGSIVPHIMAGFGGGNKLVLPGVAAYGTIVAMHSSRSPAEQSDFSNTVSGMGLFKDNPRRRDIDEVGDIIGLDMIIDAVVNSWGETVALFAGSPTPTYAAALEEAGKNYLTKAARDKDIVIANTFAKANEAITGLLAAFPSVKKEGGDVVLIANAPEGQMTHYLMGPFGNEIGGKLQLQMKPPPNVNKLILFSEYPELSSKGFLENSDKVVMAFDWQEVLELLGEDHKSGARVAVYPSSDIQYCE